MGDIGFAIEQLAIREGYSVVREFGGHGIGRKTHMAPHFGKRGTGLRLRAGMVITVEPMINLGGPELRMLSDGWTVLIVDGPMSAQLEHTVLVTQDGHQILTLRARSDLESGTDRPLLPDRLRAAARMQLVPQNLCANA